MQADVLDDFNRPDANTLGSGWTQQTGGAQIIGNRAAGTTDLALWTYNGLSATSAYVDVFNVGTGLQYLALVLAYG
ncbi:MAG: hypothetical protein NTZ17_11560, partial [Phycisphaerae bacterium]|nr:hypothetical protein [Phycisphaerae bacterium]